MKVYFAIIALMLCTNAFSRSTKYQTIQYDKITYDTSLKMYVHDIRWGWSATSGGQLGNGNYDTGSSYDSIVSIQRKIENTPQPNTETETAAVYGKNYGSVVGSLYKEFLPNATGDFSNKHYILYKISQYCGPNVKVALYTASLILFDNANDARNTFNHLMISSNDGSLTGSLVRYNKDTKNFPQIKHTTTTTFPNVIDAILGNGYIHTCS